MKKNKRGRIYMIQDIYIIDDDDASIMVFRELFRDDPEYKFTSVKTEQKTYLL